MALLNRTSMGRPRRGIRRWVTPAVGALTVHGLAALLWLALPDRRPAAAPAQAPAPSVVHLGPPPSPPELLAPSRKLGRANAGRGDDRDAARPDGEPVPPPRKRRTFRSYRRAGGGGSGGGGKASQGPDLGAAFQDYKREVSAAVRRHVGDATPTGGRVVVRFGVDDSGRVTDVRVQGAHPRLAERLRALQRVPAPRGLVSFERRTMTVVLGEGR